MAYTKQEFVDGETILSAAHLIHMEEGIEEAHNQAGTPGADGATFTPSVSEEGDLSWSNDKGLDNPATVNIRGLAGVDGYTPVKGTDYFTDAEVEEIVNRVVAQVGTGDGGTVEELQSASEVTF